MGLYWHKGIWVVLVLALFWGGCRALKDDAAGGVPAPTAAPTATPSSSAPAPSPPSPTPQLAAELTPEVRLDLLREVLGRSILAKIDLNGLNFNKDPSQSSANSSFSAEVGKVEFKQVFSEPNQGQLRILAQGDYQKMATTSGPQLLYLNPLTVDLEYTAYSPQSLCVQKLQVTGKVQCTLALIYGYAADTLDVSGQCWSHTGGVLDNLQLALGNDVHRVRYEIAVKGHGLGREFKVYQWTGAASVDGVVVDLTQIPIPADHCGK